jgi:hypothetical protein
MPKPHHCQAKLASLPAILAAACSGQQVAANQIFDRLDPLDLQRSS